MQLDKIAQLIVELHHATAEDSLKWQAAHVTPRLFTTKVKTYTVTIERLALLTDTVVPNVILRIYDVSDRLVEECSQRQNRRFKDLEALYPLVQEKTMLVSAVLDTLLAEFTRHHEEI